MGQTDCSEDDEEIVQREPVSPLLAQLGEDAQTCGKNLDGDGDGIADYEGCHSGAMVLGGTHGDETLVMEERPAIRQGGWERASLGLGLRHAWLSIILREREESDTA